MKTPEEIAREAAERLVTVASGSPQDYYRPHDVRVGGWTNRSHDREEYAASEAASIRKQVAPAVAAAINEYAAQCPVPSPLPDERLAEIRKRIEVWTPTPKEVADLLAHLDFLHRILADDVSVAAVREAERRGYERGWAEGAAAQYEACLGAARNKCEAYGECWPNDVVNAVFLAPLATPPGGPTG